MNCRWLDSVRTGTEQTCPLPRCLPFASGGGHSSFRHDENRDVQLPDKLPGRGLERTPPMGLTRDCQSMCSCSQIDQHHFQVNRLRRCSYGARLAPGCSCCSSTLPTLPFATRMENGEPEIAAEPAWCRVDLPRWLLDERCKFRCCSEHACILLKCSQVGSPKVAR